jgi:hypothetical protein
VMGYVVLPLSRVRSGRGAGDGSDCGLVNLLLAHVLAVGIAVLLCARRVLGRPTTAG